MIYDLSDNITYKAFLEDRIKTLAFVTNLLEEEMQDETDNERKAELAKTIEENRNLIAETKKTINTL